MTLRRAKPDDLPAVVGLQRAAYAKNRPLLGVEPLPLLADYAEILAEYEVYLAERDGALDGVLILEPRADDLLIWSVATAACESSTALKAGTLSASVPSRGSDSFDGL